MAKKKQYEILRGFAYDKDGEVIQVKSGGVRKSVICELDAEAVKMGKKLKCIKEVK